MAPIDLVVNTKGYEKFPADVLGACVTVDDVAAVSMTGERSSKGEPGEVVEIGSGVCVTKCGHILTAGHAAPMQGDRRRVTFPSGHSSLAFCIVTSDKYDLSILQMLDESMRGKLSHPAVSIAAQPAPVGCKLVCVGQPGVRARQRLEPSYGRVVAQSKRPLAAQLDSGGIVHDCPTHAGSSGSPLFHFETGELVGLHTGFSHDKFQAEAVTLEAIREVLAGYPAGRQALDPSMTAKQALKGPSGRRPCK